MYIAVAVSGIVLHLAGALFASASVWLLDRASRMVFGEMLLGDGVYGWLGAWLGLAALAILLAAVVLARGGRAGPAAFVMALCSALIPGLILIAELSSSTPGVSAFSIVVSALYMSHALLTLVWLAARQSDQA